MKFVQALASNKVSPVLFIISDKLQSIFDKLLSHGIKEYITWRDWERIKYKDTWELTKEQKDYRILLDSKQYSDIYKYIVLMDEDSIEHLVIFPKHINHSDMRNEITAVGEEFFKPVSAGFTNLTSFSGRSETLNLDSRPQDKDLFI